MKSSEGSIKTRSTPASLSFKGQATKHTTVKWSIYQYSTEPSHRSVQFNDTTRKLSIVPCWPLFLLWYTMEYRTSHLYFLGIHTRLKARVYTEKIQVTRGIFHSILLENINHSFNKYLMNAWHQAGINNKVYIVNEPR